MEREAAYVDILKSTARMQYHIAVILEAKADEAEKSRNWLCHHIRSSSFENDSDQLAESNQFHEQMVQAIDGITKMENGLATNLKVLLNQEETSDSGSGFADLFQLGTEDSS